ncbi:MAG: polymer-forming cytoskeletal protein [Asgard group archaeon]|nr:polymer-forming cytoskeletal protein [Asgard group archaeon]
MSKKPDLRALAGTVLEDDADFDEVHILGGLESNHSLNANVVDVKGAINLHGSLWTNRLKVQGGLKIDADVIVEMDMDIKGGSVVGGKIQARTLEAMGGVQAKEGIIVTNLTVKGGTKSNKHIEVEEKIDSTGGLTALGNITASEIKSIGGLIAEGDVKVHGSVDVRGKVEVGGDIECEEFIFKISSPSFVNGKIKANKIIIEKDEYAKMENFLRVTEIVSPSRIEIDYVIAERVVCPRLKAGQNCRIGEPLDKEYEPEY